MRNKTITKQCKICDKKFHPHAGQEAESKYCSMNCYFKGRWKSHEKVKVNCLKCGKELTDFQCNKRKYCSRKCYDTSEGHGKRPSNKRTETCKWCGKIFERPVSSFHAKTNNYFCCFRCMGDWNAEFSRNHGENNPNWNGGYSQKAYSEKWTRTKKDIKKRANGKCEICNGIHKLMDVHHKIPVVTKKDINILNHYSNLQYLCRPCHIEAEKILRGGYPHSNLKTISLK